jgi:hypothetical protein
MTGFAHSVANIPSKKPLNNLGSLKDWYPSFLCDSGTFLMRSAKSADKIMNSKSEKT